MLEHRANEEPLERQLDTELNSSMERSRILEDLLSRPRCLNGFVQDYAWGMGEGSFVQRYGRTSTSSGKYAELWFGEHPNGEAMFVDVPGDRMLSKLVSEFPHELLGERVVSTYGAQFPFLLKILSVGNALSIQAHPDEQFAKELHAKWPEQYRDPFPKPEVGIPLTPVELLYGFRPLTELREFLQPGPRHVPELVELAGAELQNRALAGQLEEHEVLRELYRAVMTSSPSAVRSASSKLYERLAAQSERTPEEEWISKLRSTYPEGDVGLFSFYFLNLVQIDRGALFIGPNIPHAYLSGELVECMAPSDNVVRAGLTPKHVDVDTLLAMLEYASQPPVPLKAVASADPGYLEYPVPLDRYFRVGEFEPKGRFHCRNTGALEMVLNVDADLALVTAEGRNRIEPGQALLVPARVAEYHLEGDGGRVFRVRVP